MYRRAMTTVLGHRRVACIPVGMWLGIEPDNSSSESGDVGQDRIPWRPIIVTSIAGNDHGCSWRQLAPVTAVEGLEGVSVVRVAVEPDHFGFSCDPPNR